MPAPTTDTAQPSSTALGDWYATVLFSKPRAALFVNEVTLLPVVTAFAPAATVLERLPATITIVLEALGISQSFIESEVGEMAAHRLTTTTNRSIVGSMNEFARLGRVLLRLADAFDPVALSLRLAEVPCGPLLGRHVSPERELAAFVAQCSC